MSKRVIVFILGLLVGALLRATLMPQGHDVPAAADTAADSRCVAHPVKMPCLFDGGH